jgi:hypothetical protein
MLRVYDEIKIEDFEGWGGAEDTIETAQNNNKEAELDQFLENEFPNGVSKTELNDFLRNEEVYIYGKIGLEECANCGTWYDKEDMKEQDGEHYCEDCHEEQFALCSGCDETFDKSDLMEDKHGVLWCEDCFEEKDECHVCGDEFDADELTDTIEGKICDTCKEEADEDEDDD